MTAAIAKTVRNALKAQGWGPSQVSVRDHSYSMGSTVRVRIKDAHVPLAQVTKVAMAFEQVRRDETGEILSGGNTHIDVAYETEALTEYAAYAKAALAEGRGRFGPFSVGPSDIRNAVAIWRQDGGVGSRVCSTSDEHAPVVLVRCLATEGLLDALNPVDPAELVLTLARRWQQAYPCPVDCPELAALWQAIEAKAADE